MMGSAGFSTQERYRDSTLMDGWGGGGEGRGGASDGMGGFPRLMAFPPLLIGACFGSPPSH